MLSRRIANGMLPAVAVARELYGRFASLQRRARGANTVPHGVGGVIDDDGR